MRNNLLTEIKLAVTVACATATAWLGALAIPVYVLVLLGITDYVTGIVAAPCRGQRRSSRVGYHGIVRKVSMLVLVGVGATLDWLLAYTANTAGIVLQLGSPVGAAVAVWLICNELVSIIENIGDLGVQLPSFLTRLTQWVARETERQLLPAGEENDNGTKTDTADSELPT